MTETNKVIDPVVDAALAVTEYIGEFRAALALEKMCQGNPNIGKPGAGRFDMKNISIEKALENQDFTKSVGVLIGNTDTPGVTDILKVLYELAPQVKQAYN